MGSQAKLKELYEVDSKHGAFYTGGLVQWTPDGKSLLCQCGPVVNLLNVETGCVNGSLGESDGSEEDDDTEDTVLTFAMSVDGQAVVTSHRSGLFRLWHFEERKVIKLWKSVHKGPVSRLALCGSGTLMASGGSDSSVRLWDLVHQSCTHNLLGVQGVVSVVMFHPDASQKLLFGAADDATIVGWDVESGKPKLALKGHFSRVCALAVHSDHKHMVSCGRDKVVILWNLDKGIAVNTIPLYEGLEGLVILPDKFRIPGYKHSESGSICVAVGGERGVVRVWNVTAAKELYIQSQSLVSKAREEGSLAITQLLWDSNTKTLGVVSVDHNIILHRLSTFECYKQLVGFSDEILDAVFLGQNDSHLALATNSTDVALYRSSDMSCTLLRGHTDLVLGLASTHANRQLLASCSKDYSIRVWLLNEDGKGASCVGHGQRHTASVGCVSFGVLSAEILVSAGQDSCIKVWTLPAKWDTGNPITINAKLTEIAHQKDINSVCVSPNDKLVATGSQDKTAKLWSVENLQLVGVLRGHRRGVWCVRFSSQDQVLLTTSADCTLKLWSLQDLSCIKTFEGHESSVVRGEFLSSGLQIITGGADGLLKLWNIKSGECACTLDQHNGRIWALAVSADESILMSGGADSLLVRWRDVTEDRRKAKAEEQEKLALEEQQLANLVQSNELLKALKLALRLQRPHQTLTIVQGILKQGNLAGLGETVSKLHTDQQQELLKYTVTWNTNTRHCYTAQAVLSVLLEQISAGHFRPEGFRSTLEGLLPYTDRHMRRLAQLQQDLHLLAFTANCMQPHAS